MVETLEHHLNVLFVDREVTLGPVGDHDSLAAD